MGGMFGHKGHLVRVAALFAAGILVFLALQWLLVPKGFGVYGHYRAGALDDNRERPLVHAGRAACIECHADTWDMLQKGMHGRVHCEACHGALAGHAADPSAGKPTKPDPKQLCARCHQDSVARPASFPQVDAADHSGGESCTRCHQAHHPLEGLTAEPAVATPPPAAAAAPKGATQ